MLPEPFFIRKDTPDTVCGFVRPFCDHGFHSAPALTDEHLCESNKKIP